MAKAQKKSKLRGSAPAKARKSATKKARTSRASAAPGTTAGPGPQRVRVPKGRRPWFFKNPEVDQVLAILIALVGEVSVIRERIDTVERLAAKKRVLSAKDIEAYRPDESVQLARDRWRAEYLDRVLRIVQEELDDVRRIENDRKYEEVVAGIAVR